MIILEGPNGTGKTTLAKRLSSDLGFEIHKFGKIPDTQDEFDLQVEKSLSLINSPIIQDRCPMISEESYGNHNRGENFASVSRSLDTIVKSKPILIYTNGIPNSSYFEYDRHVGLSYFLFFNRLIDLAFFPLLWNWSKTDYDQFLKMLRFIIANRQKEK